MRSKTRGVTLVEVMIAMVILTFGMVSFIAGFSSISRSIRVSKARTLATNLAQEQVESLKNLSYYRLLVTTSPATASETGVAGYFYDQGNYPPEEVTVGQIRFVRRTFVQKMAESGGVVTASPWTDADTGLKQITCTVIWQEGTDWRKVQVTNLRDNPNRPTLDATITGKIKSSGVAVSGVSVFTLQNHLYQAVTDASGSYTFKVPAGTYDIYATKREYFPATIRSSVTASGMSTVDMNIAQKGVGSIAGIVHLADHIVISEVCANVDGDENLEYVEIYNPMSTAVPMYAATFAYALDFSDTGGNRMSITPDSEILYVRTSIPANGYFLIASSPTVKGVSADAYYHNGGVPTATNRIPTGTAGGIRLVSHGVNESSGTVIDAVGWAGAGGSPYGPNGYRESAGYHLTAGSGGAGLGPQETLERIAYSSSTHSMMDVFPVQGIHWLKGNGFDSGDNAADFVHHTHTDNEWPQDSLMAETVGAATPAGDAGIFADDGVSASVTSQAIPVVGSFTVVNVATGNCTVLVSTKGYSKELTGVSVTAGVQTNLGNIIVTQLATKGFLYGIVRSGGSPLSVITVKNSDGQTDVTDTNGDYMFQVDPGTYIVTANPDNLNQVYTTEQSTGTTVVAGAVAQVPDLVLSQGGTVRGFVSTNGVDGLPNIPIVATNTATSVEVGTTISDAYGRFTFPNMPAATYTLTPVLESGETSTPSVLSATVTAGSSIFAGTMTVSNAFGTLRGSVKNGSASITTGVLVVAVPSPNTISTSYPPTNNQTLRNGSVVYYTASAESDGTYTLPLRGGITYNVYAWFTNFTGTTPTVTKKTASATIAAGGTATLDFTW